MLGLFRFLASSPSTKKTKIKNICLKQFMDLWLSSSYFTNKKQNDRVFPQISQQQSLFAWKLVIWVESNFLVWKSTVDWIEPENHWFETFKPSLKGSSKKKTRQVLKDVWELIDLGGCLARSHSVARVAKDIQMVRPGRGVQKKWLSSWWARPDFPGPSKWTQEDSWG